MYVESIIEIEQWLGYSLPNFRSIFEVVAIFTNQTVNACISNKMVLSTMTSINSFIIFI